MGPFNKMSARDRQPASRNLFSIGSIGRVHLQCCVGGDKQGAIFFRIEKELGCSKKGFGKIFSCEIGFELLHLINKMMLRKGDEEL